MARAPTTLDVFSAIGEPNRRRMLELLGPREMPVCELVHRLGWTQPQVSKHLGVLRRVRLVRVRIAGRRRLYSLNGPKLKPVFDWAAQFEKFWDNQLQKIKERAETPD